MSKIMDLFFTMTMLGLFLMVACTGNSVSTAPAETDNKSTIQSEALSDPSKRIDVCEPLAAPGVAFPRQEFTEGPREVMEAELVGKLLFLDGCLQIDSLYGDGNVIPVWPAEFTLKVEGDTLIILDGDGNPVIREGEEVYMSGGEGSDYGLLDCVRQQLPETCRGRYWYVGEGVRPNLRFDSDLFSLSLITSTQRTAILLQKMPILDEWTEKPSTITGKLVLYTLMRCPRIQSSDNSDFMPIWPPGYAMGFNNGKVEIRNKSGKVIVREGGEITLLGGLIPHSWESEEYRQLYHELPGDCQAPYWIVSE